MVPKRTLAELVYLWWYVPFLLPFEVYWFLKHLSVGPRDRALFLLKFSLDCERTHLAYFFRFVEASPAVRGNLDWEEVIPSGGRIIVENYLCRRLYIRRRVHPVVRVVGVASGDA